MPVVAQPSEISNRSRQNLSRSFFKSVSNCPWQRAAIRIISHTTNSKAYWIGLKQLGWCVLYKFFALIPRKRAARKNRCSSAILMLSATLFCPNLPVTLLPRRFPKNRRGAPLLKPRCVLDLGHNCRGGPPWPPVPYSIRYGWPRRATPTIVFPGRESSRRPWLARVGPE